MIPAPGRGCPLRVLRKQTTAKGGVLFAVASGQQVVTGGPGPRPRGSQRPQPAARLTLETVHVGEAEQDFVA